MEKKGSRHTCPNCEKRREFTRYEDTRTGELLPGEYGICNRLDRCGYHLNPYKDGYSQRVWELEKGDQFDSWKFQPPRLKILPKAQPPASFISNEVFKGSLSSYEGNAFVLYLISLFGEDVAGKLIGRYFIGSSNHCFRNRDFPDYISEVGANVFWQIDKQGRIRSGKIMLYDPVKGKRIKKPFNHVTWVHKKLRLEGFELRQCLFGEHLLKGDEFSPVAIVESEKTAIIASVYFPQFIWLACGAMNNLNAERCGVLKGRHVILFPDLNAFEKWSAKAMLLTGELSGTLFSVSDLLERQASEADKSEGLDLADYLTRFNWQRFRDGEKSEKHEDLNKTFLEPKGDGVAIQTVDVARIISETKTRSLNMVCVQSSSGEYLDILFDAVGNAVQPGNILPTLLDKDFKRNYQPGTLDGEPCLASIPETQRSEKSEIREAQNIPFSGPENITKLDIHSANVKLKNVDSGNAEISELERFFTTASLPSQPIKISQCETVADAAKFIDSHLCGLMANNGKRTFTLFLNRLKELQTIIKHSQNEH